jgi:5'-methylthioadenosine phosphorylase
MRIGIIGGTGIEARLAEAAGGAALDARESTTPFGRPSGPLLLGRAGGAEVALLSRHGEGHVLPPGMVPYRANIFALKAAGCTHVVAFGATGSLREHIAPGDLVVCDQLIDRTTGRERSFFERAAVHVEFAEPFCPVTRRWLLGAAAGLRGGTVHRTGCYVCIEGPSFSTRAESLMHRQWGADVVGMTALPEARLAREASLAYALVALPVDYDCWRPPDAGRGDSVLELVRANIRRATDAGVRLLAAALRDVGPLAREASPAHAALRGAVWTDRARIDPAEIERLRLLWGQQ